MTMLTKGEALELLEQSWGMEDVEGRIRRDRKKFLNELIPVIMEKLPYHTLISIVLSQLQVMKMKHQPSLREIVDVCLCGLGGTCVINNPFVYCLLNALGYSAYICRSLVLRNNKSLPHPVVIVKDLENRGDIHLVDCGMNLPTFSAIPLNFEYESPVYRDSFLEYKFVRRGDEILRMHAEGDLTNHNDPRADPNHNIVFGKWRRYYFFVLEMIKCETLDDLGITCTHRLLPAHGFPEAALFPGGKAVLILADELCIENAEGKLERTKLGNMEEILVAYSKYFPTIPKLAVVQAYTQWHHKSKL